AGGRLDQHGLSEKGGADLSAPPFFCELLARHPEITPSRRMSVTAVLDRGRVGVTSDAASTSNPGCPHVQPQAIPLATLCRHRARCTSHRVRTGLGYRTKGFDRFLARARDRDV